MSQAVADEPEKKEKPRYDMKETYTDKVSVRANSSAGLLPPRDTVAVWGEPTPGNKLLYVWTAGTALKVLKGSEITDNDGVVWVVEKATGGGTSSYYDCKVEKKPVEKKP